MAGTPNRYGKEETAKAITDGQFMISMLNARQRERLLGVLMGKIILDGDRVAATALISKVARETR